MIVRASDLPAISMGDQYELLKHAPFFVKGEFDYALPQPWVDRACTLMDGRYPCGIVWMYPDTGGRIHFGRAYPFTEEARRYLMELHSLDPTMVALETMPPKGAIDDYMGVVRMPPEETYVAIADSPLVVARDTAEAFKLQLEELPDGIMIKIAISPRFDDLVNVTVYSYHPNFDRLSEHTLKAIGAFIAEGGVDHIAFNVVSRPDAIIAGAAWCRQLRITDDGRVLDGPAVRTEYTISVRLVGTVWSGYRAVYNYSAAKYIDSAVLRQIRDKREVEKLLPKRECEGDFQFVEDRYIEITYADGFTRTFDWDSEDSGRYYDDTMIEVEEGICPDDVDDQEYYNGEDDE